MNARRCLLQAFLFVAFLMVAIPSCWAVAVIKPVHDQRQFEQFVLPNQLKVIIVSDPLSDKAAASLVVHTGSLNDPADRPGLAHFLEHMLFLGTKKYPDPDTYHAFINAHGGRDNAFTAAEITNFHFEVDHTALAGALDRFAQFFIAPTFDKTYVDRERHAVDAEYRLKFKDDGRRMMQVDKATSNPANPYSHFSVGSLQTLADRPGHPVRKALIDFYLHHYSARSMTLAVIGSDPLDVLRRMVQEQFSAIPDREIVSNLGLPPLFEPTQLGVEIALRPIKTIRQIGISFPYPWRESDYLAKPSMVLGHLIGHEGNGSLLALLKARGWANGLSAGKGLKVGQEAVFSISIDLTEQGYDHRDAVKDLVFGYLNLLKTRGVQPWVIDELRTINTLDFRFRDEPPAMSEAIGLAGNLQHFTPEQALQGPYLIQGLDEARIQAVLGYLLPDNARIMSVAPGDALGLKEPWYGTSYQMTPVKSKQVAQWQRETPDSALALPLKNPFLPEHTDLKTAGTDTRQPELLMHGPGFDIWHKQDTDFSMPKADVYWGLGSALSNDSPRHGALTSLWVGLANDALNPYVYPAQIAGLSYHLSGGRGGVGINVSGFDDKEAGLLELVLDQFINLKVNDARFAVIKERALRRLRNRSLDRPYRQAGRYLSVLLMQRTWGVASLLKTMESLQPDDLRAFMPKVLSALRVRALFHGNMTAQETRRIARALLDKVFAHAQPIPPVVRQIVRLDSSFDYLFRHQVDHDDSAVSVYYQGDRDDVKQQSAMALLHQIIRTPFFNQLRTQQQLGYVVYSGLAQYDRVPGLVFVVQSPKLGPDALVQRIDHFLETFVSGLGEMDVTVFEQERRGLLSRIEQRDTQLAERSGRYASDLALRYTGFDHRQRMAKAVRALSQQELADFAHQLISLKHRKRLLVEMFGRRFHGQSAQWQLKPGRVFIDDMRIFRQSLPVFELPVTEAPKL